jgi:hypothetical protein
MGVLDRFFQNLNGVMAAGVRQVVRPYLNFVPPFTIADNAANQSQDIGISGIATVPNPLAAGTVLTSTGTGLTPSWQAPSPTGWQTAYSLDFTAQPSQSLPSNINYTIGGETWARENSAQDNTALAIVNGTGLVGNPSLGTSFGHAVGIQIPVTSIIPGWHLNMPIRLTMQSTTTNTTHSLSMIAAIGNASIGSMASFISVGRQVNSTPVLGNFAFWGISGLGSGNGPTSIVDVASASNDVTQCIAPNGVQSMLANWGSGVYSAGAFPTQGAYTPIFSSNPAASSNTLSSAMGTASGWYLFVGVYNPLSLNEASATIERLLVEYINE